MRIDFINILSFSLGGIASARRAAEYGAKVAVVESGRLGGTCVNVGCVPKKVMWNTAALAENLHDSKDYGFTTGEISFDWKIIKEKRDAYVKRLNGIYDTNLDNSGVKLYRGEAKFNGVNSVQVGEETVTATHVLIATGGKPALPKLPGIEHVITRYVVDHYFSSN